MIDFARNVRRILGQDEFAVYRAERIGAEVYLGRFGRRIAYPREWDGPGKQVDPRNIAKPDGEHDVSGAVEVLAKRRERWLITCDWGVVELGARKTMQDGPRQVMASLPHELGEIRLVGDRVVSASWGQLYLIELPTKGSKIRVSAEPQTIPNVPANRKLMSWAQRGRVR
jgi:hypothetical protein